MIHARLGHGSITTTLNTHGHIMSHADESAAAKLDALLAIEREVDDPICKRVANAVMGRS